MKQYLLVAVLLVFGSFACTHAPKNPVDHGSTWTGDYFCPQGQTALRLKILDNDSDDIRGVFEFFHLASGARGSFYLNGKYDHSTRALKFSPGEWINHPPNYVAVGLDGQLSDDLVHYHGKIDNDMCGEFNLTKSNP